MELFKHLISDYGVIGIIISFVIIFVALIVVGSVISFLTDKKETKKQIKADKWKQASGKNYEKNVSEGIKANFGTTPLLNILMQTKRTADGFTEADMVFVNKKGVFCVECKSKSFDDSTGDCLEGTLTNEIWTHELKNPVKQNNLHIAALHDFLGKDIPIFNLVVLSRNFSISYLGRERNGKNENNALNLLRSEGVAIVKYTPGIVGVDGLKTLSKQIDDLPNNLTENQIADITSKLKPLVASKEQQEAHVRRKREIYGDD